MFGAAGRMGRTVCEAVAADPALELVAAVDPHHAGIDLRRVADVDSDLQVAASPDALVDAGAEVVVDFTVADAARQNLAFAAEHGLHAVVGTTGFTDADLAAIEAAFTESSCLVAANFAIGAVLMMRFAELAAPWFETVEIIELHHDGKVDAPSGTAMRTAERIAAASERLGRRPHHDDGGRGRPRGRGPRRHPDPLGAAAGPVRPPGGAARHGGPVPVASATTPTTAPATCPASSSPSSTSPSAPASPSASNPCSTSDRDGREPATSPCPVGHWIQHGWEERGSQSACVGFDAEDRIDTGWRG